MYSLLWFLLQLLRNCDSFFCNNIIHSHMFPVSGNRSAVDPGAVTVYQADCYVDDPGPPYWESFARIRLSNNIGEHYM